MRGWPRVLQAVYVAFALLVFAGVATWIVAHGAAALMILAGVIGFIGSHILAGVVQYRKTMRRPWPRVSPVEDDDDDW